MAATKTKSCAANLISNVIGWHVRVVIYLTDGEYRIFITDLGAGLPHSYGVHNIIVQFGNWYTLNNLSSDFKAGTDGVQEWVGLNGATIIRAPDLVIVQRNPSRRRGFRPMICEHHNAV